MKRIAALLLAIPLLQLNALRAEIACGRHDAANHTEVVAHEGAHANHAPQQGTHTQEESSDVPAQSECCQALASCSLAFGMDAVASSTATPKGRDTLIVALTDIPLSRIAPPDPPPPKA
jgi:hypothetical protein